MPSDGEADTEKDSRPPCVPNLPEEVWLADFRRRLRAWYSRHARDLPWRRDRNPYGVWISEIMLQQTQVATVKPYFERFLAAFPRVEDLAEADEQEVLRLWEGLGYYRRARQLHRAAAEIVSRHGGEFPRDVEAARRLPGIGRYTAGAILSIAFDARQPILEANTTRLFARLLAYRGFPGSSEGSRRLWSMAEAVLPRRGVGTFNQALMELGSEVCTARAPRCDTCPVATLCRARAEGREADIPLRKPRPLFEVRHEVAVVVWRRDKVLLLRCPEGQRWAGLWDFPRFQVDSETPASLAMEIAAKVAERTGVTVRLGDHLKTIKHGVTRFRITLDCYEAHHLSGPNGKTDLPETRWLRPDELTDYPLSTTGRKLSEMIRWHGSNLDVGS
ncbi:MAG: A/G-specific adenine glycosylase [Rhodopirellula sp.]|nr:A/G-specific adenine glycosylase [Rhodopirellula sp.]